MDNTQLDIDKIEFYALCTVDFTKEWVEKIKNLRQWIKQML